MKMIQLVDKHSLSKLKMQATETLRTLQNYFCIAQELCGRSAVHRKIVYTWY